LGYYAYAQIVGPGIGDLRAPTVWLVIACQAGPLLGLAGQWWRSGSAIQRLVGTALFAGAFIGEGLFHFVRIADHHIEGIASSRLASRSR
jgi:hypothetical protein